MQRLGRALESVADGVWRAVKRHPYVGITAAAGVGLVAAYAIGPAELAVAVAAGYAAYQVLQLNVPPSEAIRRAARVEGAFGI